ncbi:MAG: adenylyltransferase/cytidyltransferase family protein, partial [Clostridiales bacterium]|nr:adenylyltransferase/cytidyltransferase family protein [Clostridiales bacterium]
MKELTTEEVCLALGYFDSVHLGHRNLINVAREYAHKNGIGCAVATFSNNAYKLFNFDGKQVYTYAERCELLKDLCDYILPMRFDARLKNYNAEQFLNLLTTRHNIKALVCGYDYSFGAGAKGDSRVLKEYCDKRGIDCMIVPKYEADGERISTTIVKDLLVSGKIEDVNTLLGAPFMLRGRVVRGRGAGRMFDNPTANIKFSSGKMLPANGVYGTTCSIEGKVYDCETNIG